MNLEDLLRASVICDNHNVAFLADTNSTANTVYNLLARMRVKGEVVKTSIGQPVPVVFGFLDTGDEADFGECRYTFMDTTCATSQSRDSFDKRCRDNFMVFTTQLDLPTQD